MYHSYRLFKKQRLFVKLKWKLLEIDLIKFCKLNYTCRAARMIDWNNGRVALNEKFISNHQNDENKESTKVLVMRK